MAMLFPLPPAPSVPIVGSPARFPVRRIFCVGQNYAAHAREMGSTPDRDEPMFFTKHAAALCPSGATIPYPPGTANYHFEMELVVAIGEQGVFGYACGLDMTRRDLQARAKAAGKPWDLAKNFENAAVIAAITPAEGFGPLGSQRIALSQNGEVRQDAALDEMVWSVPQLLAALERYYTLAPGDLLYTGTPAGVGPVSPGDRLVGTIDGLEPVELAVVG